MSEIAIVISCVLLGAGLAAPPAFRVTRRGPWAPPANGTSVSGDEKLPKKNQEKPPYTAYACLNPYNLSLLAGAGVVSAATGGWWIGLCAVAAETIWMLFAPDSTVLRRTWFDKLWDQDQRDAKLKEQAKKFAALPSE